jgi:hypothetical protein
VKPILPATVGIALGNSNLVAIVDAEDVALVEGCKWYPMYGPCNTYAQSKRGPMHRIIIAAPPGVEVDHRNHNGLDNRRSNLRLATTLQNAGNRRKQRVTHSGGLPSSQYKGVTLASRFCGKGSDWRLRAKYNWVAVIGKQLLGYFTDEIQAALAYDEAALELYGEFALLNFPEEVSTERQDSHARHAL